MQFAKYRGSLLMRRSSPGQARLFPSNPRPGFRSAPPPLALLAALCFIVTAVADDRPPIDLPVKRVALFSSGVAYYECEATVDGAATASMQFRTQQINDIIKSMVVQDFDGGTVGVISYASQAPIDRTLKSFGVDITGKPTLGQLLDQLRGEPVQITGGRAVTGTIVGVERQKVIVEKEVVEQDVLNILTDRGLVQLRMSELQGVKLTNEKIDAELRNALATLATSHDADKKNVVLRFDGQGKRHVRVAYLLEAPIWKTSYRLVLDPEGKPFLQGWATVENATEDDWRDVRLSLISGRPISFTMDLYSPLYIPRPREELELYASLRPPTYEGGIPAEAAKAPAPTMKSLAAAARADAGENANQARRGFLGRSGGRVIDGSASTSGDKDRDGVADERRPLGLENAGVASVADARDAGELFEYGIRTPVSIPRQHSAMLPVINQAVQAEKVSIYNPATHPKYPLNGLQLTNSTDLHIMQGPVTVFEDGVYAGDAKLPDLKPGEQRLIGYALDLGVEVTMESKPTPDELVSLRINKGVLIHRHKYVDSRLYKVRNKLQKPRSVLLEQAYGDDWKLIDPEKPTERAPGLSRFRVEVPPGKVVEQKVVLENLHDEGIGISELGYDVFRFYLESRVISPAVRDALQKVVALRTERDRISNQRQGKERDVNEAVAEQARIRENLKTLERGSDAHKRQLDKFDKLETQIEGFRTELATLRQSEEAKSNELQNYLMNLNVE